MQKSYQEYQRRGVSQVSKKIRKYKISDHEDGADFHSRQLAFRGEVVSLLALHAAKVLSVSHFPQDSRIAS
ncbi:hypothetical protein GCM10011391_22260 [Pullulanibacillus camelliae]|uniref:Uncharacterized protein n=1 Tax=Pullulanibacillus camelliae TaxID=1707096 RepID=A0A8J3DUA7_9BACL|nr:hypothetical protein GCM10011391_22260 [Pullulanibacillus camelliae]